MNARLPANMYSGHAYFAVVGEGDFRTITNRLGFEPTRGWSEGDLIRGRSDRTHPATCWLLETDLPRSEGVPLERHIEALLQLLEPHGETILALRPDYQALVICVACFERPITGFSLEPSLMQRLIDLELRVDFDMYSDDGSEDDFYAPLDS